MKISNLLFETQKWNILFQFIIKTIGLTSKTFYRSRMAAKGYNNVQNFQDMGKTIF